MESNFKMLQEEILQKAKEKNACRDEYRNAARATNEAELLVVIKTNIVWCKEQGIISNEYFQKFTQEIFYQSGIANSGKDNTGYSNTGDRNTGDWNTGDRNTGDWNTGDRNTGYSNTGYWNTGYRNTGDRNTGDWNTGDWNTGDWNTGDRNTGYSNTGDSNTGFFCISEKNPKIPMFNKPSDWTIQDVHNCKAFRLMSGYVDTKMWISADAMTEQEKEKYPAYKTAGGYVKDIPFKEAFTNAWHNWSEDCKNEFKQLLDFDAAIFEEITGVKI